MEKKNKMNWIQIVAIVFIALFCVAVALFGYHIEQEKATNAISTTAVSETIDAAAN